MVLEEAVLEEVVLEEVVLEKVVGFGGGGFGRGCWNKWILGYFRKGEDIHLFFRDQRMGKS